MVASPSCRSWLPSPSPATQFWLIAFGGVLIASASYGLFTESA